MGRNIADKYVGFGIEMGRHGLISGSGFVKNPQILLMRGFHLVA
jgi:hypothetical protein